MKEYFLGYSLNSKAYKVYNKRTITIEESIHVAFDEINSSKEKKGVFNDDDTNSIIQNNMKKKRSKDTNQVQDKSEVEEPHNLPKEWRVHKDHPIDKVIGDINKGVFTH